jgi:hypothetical protein
MNHKQSAEGNRRENIMRKLLFALAIMVTGAFAFAAGSPASAVTAGPVTSMGDIVKSDATLDQVRWYRGGHCWRHPWHWYCRRHHHRHYRRHYYRRYW